MLRFFSNFPFIQIVRNAAGIKSGSEKPCGSDKGNSLARQNGSGKDNCWDRQNSSDKSNATDGILTGCRKKLLRPSLYALFLLFLCLLIYHTAASPPDFLLSEEQRFVKFTENVFRNEMSGSTLNLHYTIADPSAYEIDDNNTALGNASLSARKQSCAVTENYFSTLQTFDRKKLSEKRQLTYDVFYHYLETELSASSLLLYDEPLSPTLGVQAQLPILLAEYNFRTKGDIEDYLCLLTQIPDYFSSILSFEQEKANAGLFMSEDCALAVMQQCQEFIADGEKNYLITIFNEKIDKISNLTADEKIAYKTRSQSIMEGYVLPAYQSLISGIAALENTGTNDMGLYYFPQGQEYYRYLIRSKVGDDREIEEIEEEIKAQMVEDFTAIQEIVSTYYKQDAAETESDTADTASESMQTVLSAAVTSSADTQTVLNAAGTASADTRTALNTVSADTQISLSAAGTASAGTQSSSADDPAEILNELRQKIAADFPLLPSVSCSVKYVHESMQEYLSPAFYLTPAIDDYANNVIYINPSSDYSGLDLYTTLAHEGYPGHLYQSVYFNAGEPDLLRCLLDVGGYTEGWATYVEMYAYSLWEEDPILAKLGQKNRSFTLGLASLLDIGIHYRGYSPDEVTLFLEKLGFGSDTAASLYQSILQSPANYLQYYVGYLNFSRLRDTMQAAAGDRFSLKEFHRIVLDAGSMPFSLLEEQVKKSY